MKALILAAFLTVGFAALPQAAESTAPLETVLQRLAERYGFALQMAEEVKASGVARVLEPMSSADRKIVHDTLSEFDGIVTRSEGEDPQRRVIIAPAND